MNENNSVEEKEDRILGEKEEVIYDPTDPWLFTSKSAKDSYRRNGKLDELEQDIRSSVMGGRQWMPDDIGYLREIKRLVDDGTVEEEASRWAVSPFPPVYKAIRSGEMTIGGLIHRFKKGEELVFQCRMHRETKGLPGPVLISEFTPAKRDRYCGDMAGMGEMGEQK